MTTEHVFERIVKPLTTVSQTALCKLLPSHMNAPKSSWFISHAWQYNFLELCDAIITWFEENHPDPDSVVIWLDLFTNSQHDTQVRPFEWWSETFVNAVRGIGKVLLVMNPWKSPVPFTRAWCIYEVYSCIITQSEFHVALTRKERGKFLVQLQNDANSIYEMFRNIRSEFRTARGEQDKIKIHEAVRATVGFNALDNLLFGTFNKWTETVVQSQISASGNSKETLKWKNTLADLYGKQGKYKDAEPLRHDCVDGSQTSLGDFHPTTLAHVNNLAQLYLHQGNYDHAEPMYRECLKRSERAHGEEHQTTLTFINSLAVLNFNKNDYGTAEQMFHRCLDIRRRTLGSDHSDTVNTMNNLATYIAFSANLNWQSH
ncbi:hypothetical protein BJ742DRAFT_754643, partial [Cladochytrium replicatum]